MNGQRQIHRIDVVAIVIAVIGVSFSGPMMAACAAPALAIAFWRTFLGTIATAPVALRQRAELHAAPRRAWLFAIAAGLGLAAHFATWIPSLHFTSIASATALVATQVIFNAFIAFGQGHRAPRLEWIGIGIALVGAIALTGIDFSLDARSLVGDLLALLGAAAGAVYYACGQEARKSLPSTVYTTVAYAVAAVALFGLTLLLGFRLTGFSGRDWALIVGVTLFAQLGGHSMMNQALRSFTATALSLVILLEVPGAILVGWVWPGQTPPWQLLPALLLILSGLYFTVRAQRPTTVVDPES